MAGFRIEGSTSGNVVEVTNANRLQVDMGTPSTSSITSVSAVATSTQLLPYNASRKGGTFYNDSTNNLYLALTSGNATTSAYTVKIPAAGFFEIPFPIWQGQITGVWDGTNGAVRITELS